MNGISVVRVSAPGGQSPGTAWSIQGVADFDGNRRNDILWRNSAAPYMQPRFGLVATNPLTVLLEHADIAWNAQAIGDFNHDMTADLLWRTADAKISIWILSGTSFIRGIPLPAELAGTEWQIKGLLRD